MPPDWTRLTERLAGRWYDPPVSTPGARRSGDATRRKLGSISVGEADSESDAAVTHSAALSRMIIDIATSAAGELHLDQILHEALDRLRTVSPLTGGSIALLYSGDLPIRAAVRHLPDEALR